MQKLTGFGQRGFAVSVVHSPRHLEHACCGQFRFAGVIFDTLIGLSTEITVGFLLHDGQNAVIRPLGDVNCVRNFAFPSGVADDMLVSFNLWSGSDRDKEPYLLSTYEFR